MFTISCFARMDLPDPDTPNIKELPFRSSKRFTIMSFFVMALFPRYRPLSWLISCALNGIIAARLSVVSVLRILNHVPPYGKQVLSPSNCCHLRMAREHKCRLAHCIMLLVSASSCFLLSAVCTIVMSVGIIR